MKRAARVLIWLHPSSWRKRYGAEFEALLEDATLSALDGFDIVLGALKMRMTTNVLTKIVLAGTAVGVAVAMLVFVEEHEKDDCSAVTARRIGGTVAVQRGSSFKGSIDVC